MKVEITAQVSATIDYSEEYREWLKQKYPNSYQRLRKEHQSFLMEHTKDWDEALASTIEYEVEDYLDTEVNVEIVDSVHEEGSLTIIAGIAICIIEIAKVAIPEVINYIKERKMKKAFSEKINEVGRDPLCDEFHQDSCQANMPVNIFYAKNVTINNISVNGQNNYN
jgi:hypothetical protein